MKRLIASCCLLALAGAAMAQREIVLMDRAWRFHTGDASSMERDFTHGTEYFTYLSKAVGQNQGPASEQFNDSAWARVNLPHDWVVALPFSSEASHSHGYKQVGWRYPANSVGWYRKRFAIPATDRGKHIAIRLEGVFRNSQVFCNGFYLGHEPSGYATSEYRLDEYLNYGGDNVITVRCDASTEEGWYYEGAGIYRHVWLIKTQPTHFRSDGIFFRPKVSGGEASFSVTSEVDGPDGKAVRTVHRLVDAYGSEVARSEGTGTAAIPQPHLWSPADPYLYTLCSQLIGEGGQVVDEVRTRVGLRTVEFDTERGLLLNGQAMKLRGVNMHLDHAGVGTAMLDELWRYEITKLRELGVNAIRCSHNPASPAMLDLCDEMGILVIDENRLMGVNDEHLSLLRRMIERDRNHPSVMLWSVGNEEWWIESSPRGEAIARTMVDAAHSMDPTRLCTYGNSGGYGLTRQVDIHGYNYIVQNDVERRHSEHPDWFIVGSEETSGCGTRNVYRTDSLRGWMASINYEGEERSNGEKNVIERGWRYYRDHTFAGGLFYWTGFDYRGEPNPMKWPATGSQFGILDYCGFPKDEAWYLRAAWTQKPVLHILPHWNLAGREGQEVEVWAYSNMDEVELLQDGHSLGRQRMPRDGHLVWRTTYRPGHLVARGYRGGRLGLTTTVETIGPAQRVAIEASKATLRADSQDATVVDISLLDRRGRLVPDACAPLTVTVSGPATIMGWGNGDPAFKDVEQPANAAQERQMEIRSFMGHAQVIVRGADGEASAPVVVTVGLSGVHGGQQATVRLSPAGEK